MSILPRFLLAYHIVICFLSLGLPNFSFASGPGSAGLRKRELRTSPHQREVDKGAEESGERSGERNFSLDASSLIERNEISPDVRPKDNSMRKSYLDRSQFLDRLANDLRDFRNALTAAVDPQEGIAIVKAVALEKATKQVASAGTIDRNVIFKKIVEVASRLSIKYTSPGEEKGLLITIPNLRTVKSKFLNSEDNYWQTEEMMQLEADQEYYEAFKEKEEAALQFLDLHLQDEAFYCHNIATGIDCLSQYFNPDSPMRNEIESQGHAGDDQKLLMLRAQQAIMLSFLLKSPTEIRALTEDQQRAELLLFKLAKEEQKKIENNQEDVAKYVDLVRRYQVGGFSKKLDQITPTCKELLSKEEGGESRQKTDSEQVDSTSMRNHMSSSNEDLHRTLCKVFACSFGLSFFIVAAHAYYIYLLHSHHHKIKVS